LGDHAREKGAHGATPFFTGVGAQISPFTGFGPIPKRAGFLIPHTLFLKTLWDLVGPLFFGALFPQKGGFWGWCKNKETIPRVNAHRGEKKSFAGGYISPPLAVPPHHNKGFSIHRGSLPRKRLSPNGTRPAIYFIPRP